MLSPREDSALTRARGGRTGCTAAGRDGLAAAPARAEAIAGRWLPRRRAAGQRSACGGAGGTRRALQLRPERLESSCGTAPLPVELAACCCFCCCCCPGPNHVLAAAPGLSPAAAVAHGDVDAATSGALRAQSTGAGRRDPCGCRPIAKPTRRCDDYLAVQRAATNELVQQPRPGVRCCRHGVNVGQLGMSAEKQSPGATSAHTHTNEPSPPTLRTWRRACRRRPPCRPRCCRCRDPGPLASAWRLRVGQHHHLPLRLRRPLVLLALPHARPRRLRPEPVPELGLLPQRAPVAWPAGGRPCTWEGSRRWSGGGPLLSRSMCRVCHSSTRHMYISRLLCSILIVTLASEELHV